MVVRQKYANRPSQSTMREVTRSDGQKVPNYAYDHRSAAPLSQHRDVLPVADPMVKINRLVDDVIDIISEEDLYLMSNITDKTEPVEGTMIYASADAIRLKNAVARVGAAMSDEIDARIIDDIGYREYMSLLSNAENEGNQIFNAINFYDSLPAGDSRLPDLERVISSEYTDGSCERLAAVMRPHILSTLSGVRKMGGKLNICQYTSQKDAAWIKDSTNEIIPTDWLNRDAKSEGLYIKYDPNMPSGILGNYNDSGILKVRDRKFMTGVLRVGPNTQDRTIIHELGHRFNHMIGCVQDVERSAIVDSVKKATGKTDLTDDGGMRIGMKAPDVSKYGKNARTMMPVRLSNDQYAYTVNKTGSPELFPTGLEHWFGGGMRTGVPEPDRDNVAMGILASL